MTMVKICGIQRVEDALVATDAGADFLGFVFYERSRRRINPEAAREIVDAVRERSHAETVGVFVNADPEEMNRIARAADLDYVQLSGDEPDEITAALDVPAIQVIHMGGDLSAGHLTERIAESSAHLVMLDTASGGAYGGTGQAFDWERVPRLERDVLLAGGLRSENVGEAVRRVNPWGVDVSSGVERNGEKDHERIREFVRSAKGPERRTT